jgi:hypothetical protein
MEWKGVSCEVGKKTPSSSYTRGKIKGDPSRPGQGGEPERKWTGKEIF